MIQPLEPRTRAAVAYGAAAVLSLLAAFKMLHLWGVSLRVPLDYGGDATFHAYLVKSVIDHGWYLNNPSVGAPGGLHLQDFPVLDIFHLAVIRVMSLFSGDWALLFNVYHLLGFPLITLSALAALRQFRVDYGPAIVVSILYAFLPSRLIKGEGHLFLDLFYQVPLMLMVALWVCGDDPPFLREREDGRRLPRLDLRSDRAWAAAFICLIGAFMSVYYAFFAAWLIVAGGAWASLERRSLRNVLSGVALAGVIFLGLTIAGLPSMTYRLHNGPDRDVSYRVSGEAEVYALKITQLLLPTHGHRVVALADLKERYDVNAPLLTENNQATLGVVGAIGFLALLIALFVVPREPRPRNDLVRRLAMLNGVAVLVATLGGFGSLFALLVSPQIRTYTRMNVLISFLALFASALLLQRLCRRWPRAGVVVLLGVLGIGLEDQRAPGVIRPYAAEAKGFANDRDLVRRIEAAVPSNAIILELPYITFPEASPEHDMGSYDHLVPYLHSHKVRWTWPAMRGRASDVWLSKLSKEPVPTLISDLRGIGGAGILVDRAGYADNGAALEAELRAATGAQAIVDGEGRRSFYKIPALAN